MGGVSEGALIGWSKRFARAPCWGLHPVAMLVSSRHALGLGIREKCEGEGAGLWARAVHQSFKRA